MSESHPEVRKLPIRNTVSLRMQQLMSFSEAGDASGFDEKRVTVRLTAIQYGALLLMAGRLEITPTAMAEELLDAAIEEALPVFGYEDYDAALPDITNLLKANSKLRPAFDAQVQEEVA